MNWCNDDWKTIINWTKQNFKCKNLQENNEKPWKLNLEADKTLKSHVPLSKKYKEVFIEATNTNPTRFRILPRFGLFVRTINFSFRNLFERIEQTLHSVRTIIFAFHIPFEQIEHFPNLQLSHVSNRKQRCSNGG